MSQSLRTLNCTKCGAPLPADSVGDVTCTFCGTITRIERETADDEDPKTEELEERIRELERERAHPPELTTIIVSPNPIHETITRPRPARNAGAGRLFGCLFWLALLGGLAYYVGIERLTSVAQDIRTTIEQQITARNTPALQTTTHVIATATVARARSTIAPPLVPNPTTEATPTDTPSPTNTPRPALPTRAPAPPAVNSNCVEPRNAFLSPLDGLTLRGRVTLNSDASLSGYEYYKFEVRPEGADDNAWRLIYRQDNPTNVRMTWDTTTIATGRYQLRFVTVDRTGNFPTPCLITVNVAR